MHLDCLLGVLFELMVEMENGCSHNLDIFVFGQLPRCKGAVTTNRRSLIVVVFRAVN
jgi:hypothetical protein